MDDSYNHSVSKAKIYASETFARLEKEKLPATPDIYELFYSYYSGNNPEVVRSLDIMESQNYVLTTQRCRELHKRLLDSDRSKETLQKAEQVIGDTLVDVDTMITDVKASHEGITGSMNKISGDMATDSNDPKVLKKMLEDMMTETRKMVDENKALEQKLASNSNNMQQLKSEMEQVREQAYTDSLTKIANRKKFDLEIEAFMMDSREAKKPLALIYMDIDHFKSFNDTYGHQIGDQVLRMVAKTLKDGVKGRDLPCRFGGEEFVIVLPETDQDSAEQVGNALRESVKAKEIRNRSTGETLTRVTISGGVAVLKDEEELKEWVERADKALYQAKRKGRDRIMPAE